MGSLIVLLWLVLASVVGQLGPHHAADAFWPALQPATTAVERRAGRPLFVVDGQPYFPIGVTYHFTRHRLTWEYDLSLMRRLGLNTVRADLAWRDVEGLWEGNYRFDLLDEFLAAAARHRLRVVLVFSYATSDSNVPWWYWLGQGRADLARIRHGSLQSAQPSINDPFYRAHMRDYIARTVAHVKDSPALLAYQVLNEPRLNEQPTVDRGPYTVAAFRTWLAGRYGTIGDLNALWPSDYHSFDSVFPPSAADLSLAHVLSQRVEDWRQFSYENLAALVDDLSASIRAADGRHALLVAEMSWWWWGQQPATGVSPWHIYRAADIVGFDVYPDSVEHAHYYGLNADMLARFWDKPVWVMELNRKDGRPEPGEIRRFAQEAVNYGATGIFYFSWRDHPLDGGDYGLLDRNGQPKPQFAGYAKAVTWLRDQAGPLLAGLPPTPDVYLVWPTRAVSRTPGLSSPSWQVFDTATRLIGEGKRVGLIEETTAAGLPSRTSVIKIGD